MTAQDFYKAFKVGADNEHITPIDTAGVAMAAIQGLHAELLMRDKQIAAQQGQIQKQQTQFEKQQRQLKQQQILLNDLRKLVCAQNPNAEVCK